MEENKKNKVPNVPNLRFIPFNDPWQTIKLREVSASLKSGLSRMLSSSNIGIPVIRANNVKQDMFVNCDFKYWYKNDPQGAKVDNYLVKKGDILINFINSGTQIGTSCIYNGELNEECIYTTNILRLRTSHRLNNYFFQQYTNHKSYKKYIRSIEKPAVNQSSFTTVDFLNMFIKMPSLDEQLKISAFLKLINDRINTQNKIIKEKEILIKSLNDYLYNKSSKKEYKICSLFTQYGGLSGKTADDFGKGSPYITFLSVLNNTYITNESTQLVDILKEEKQNVVKYGDLVLTLSSETPEEVGVSAVSLIKEPVYLNSFCMGLNSKNSDIVHNEYMSWLFSTMKFRKHIFPFAQGSTRFNLNVGSFMNSTFKYPSLEEQIKIAGFLKKLLSELELEKTILQKYISQRKHLLRNMFI